MHRREIVPCNGGRRPRDRLSAILLATKRQAPRRELSIVTSLYHSSAFLGEFHARVSEHAARLTTDFEIVLVNDGFPDRSLELAIEQSARDPRVRVIDLSRTSVTTRR